MAKFCTKCGKQLEDGQVCDCEASKASTTTNTSSSTSSIDFKESGKDCLEVVKGIFVKPVETIKKFVAEDKFVTGLILIVAAALAAGIFVVATNASIASEFYKPNYLKLFFTDFAEVLVRYVIMVAAGFALISFVFKGKTTWKQMACIVGISIVPVIAQNLIFSILVFVDADFVKYVVEYISVFVEAFSVILLYKGVEETAELDKNKLMLGAASVYVAVAIAMDIYAKIVK